RNHAGELARLFAGDPTLTPDQRRLVESEEAWTLGVTAANQRPIPVPAAPVAPHPPAARMPPSPRLRGEGRGERQGPVDYRYTYLRDPAAISRRSFALIRKEADLARFPRGLRTLAARVAHA